MGFKVLQYVGAGILVEIDVDTTLQTTTIFPVSDYKSGSLYFPDNALGQVKFYGLYDPYLDDASIDRTISAPGRDSATFGEINMPTSTNFPAIESMDEVIQGQLWIALVSATAGKIRGVFRYRDGVI